MLILKERSWHARRDSNPRPMDSKSTALSSDGPLPMSRWCHRKCVKSPKFGYGCTKCMFGTNVKIGSCKSLFSREYLGWREDVGVEPTRDGFAPHTGFEDQEAHRNLCLPVFIIQDPLVAFAAGQARIVEILQYRLCVFPGELERIPQLCQGDAALSPDVFYHK